MGDLLSGSRFMEGGEIFSTNGDIWTGLVTFWVIKNYFY